MYLNKDLSHEYLLPLGQYYGKHYYFIKPPPFVPSILAVYRIDRVAVCECGG